MRRVPRLTHKRLLEVLRYEPETGAFVWLKCGHTCQHFVGKRAGWILRQCNRRVVRVDGERFYVGPLAWFYMNGQWPTHEVDHRNRDGTDDRWDNLRHATPSQNCANRRLPTKFATNTKGVYRLGPSWVAHIKVDKKLVHLGCFKTREEAAEAFQQAQRKIHGDFAHAGST